MQDLQMLQDAERPLCALAKIHVLPETTGEPSFVKSRMLRPLQTHFLLFQQGFNAPVISYPSQEPKFQLTGAQLEYGNCLQRYLFQ